MDTTWRPDSVTHPGVRGPTQSVPPTGFLVGMGDRSRASLVWRSLLAAPFALALLLTLILGPATIDSQYVSAGFLAITSLVTIVLLLVVADWLLIPVGLVALVLFPLLAGVGFYFAPAWSLPLVVILFYGSIVASAAAVATGVSSVVRGARRRQRNASAGKAVTVALLMLSVLTLSAASTPSQTNASTAAYPLSATNMGPVINSGHREAEPSFTADGHTMYFNCQDDKICLTHLTGSWEGGGWSSPKLLASPINSQYGEVEPVIALSGDKLYITSIRPFGSGQGMPGLGLYVGALFLFNATVADPHGVSVLGGLGHDKIWVSHLTNGSWSVPENLDLSTGEPPVNGAFNDHCIFVSIDGSEVFWTSDRPGGYGGNDIWTMQRVNGKWSKPKNLGSNINGPYSDHHSMLSPDGTSLYVTSGRPSAYGGEEIYVSTRGANGTWSPLVILPPPINASGTNRCPALTPDNRIFIFDSERAGGHGSKDLWWVYFKDVPGGT